MPQRMTKWRGADESNQRHSFSTHRSSRPEYPSCPACVSPKSHAPAQPCTLQAGACHQQGSGHQHAVMTPRDKTTPINEIRISFMNGCPRPRDRAFLSELMIWCVAAAFASFVRKRPASSPAR